MNLAVETVRLRLERLARIITRSDCCLNWAGTGTGSTDLKNIQIDPLVSGGGPLAGRWVRLLAVTVHEAYHILWSSIDDRREMVERLPENCRELALCVSNICEDGRIETLGGIDRPGTKAWLHFLNHGVWEKSKASGDTAEDLLQSLNSRAVLGMDTKGVSNEVKEILDSVQYLLDQAVTAATCKECMECAGKITLELSKYIKNPRPPKTGKPVEMPGGMGQAAPEETAGKARMQRSSGRKRRDKESSKSQNGPSGESNQKRSKSQECNKQDGRSEDNGSSNERSSKSKKNEAEGSGSKSSGSSKKGDLEDGRSGKSRQSKKRDSSGKNIGEGKPDRISSSDGEIEPAAPAVDFDEVLSSAEKEIGELLTKEKHPGAERVEQVDIGTVHTRIQLKEVRAVKDPVTYRDIRREMIPHAQRAARLLKPLFVPRRGEVVRNLKRGSLDVRECWRLPRTAETAVFQKKILPGKKLDAAVYLLVDSSGSMSYDAKYHHARLAASLFAECLSILKVPYTVTGFSAENPFATHYRVVDWGENEKSGIAGIKAERNNRDGYSIRTAANELLRRREKARILVVISDGLPNDRGYSGGAAVRDTRKAVREVMKKGILVQGILINQNKSEQEQAGNIYPNLVIVEDYRRLPNQIAYKLRKLLFKFK